MLCSVLLLVLLAMASAYHLHGVNGGANAGQLQAIERQRLMMAKRSSGSGGGALPPAQSDNIQSWGTWREVGRWRREDECFFEKGNDAKMVARRTA